MRPREAGVRSEDGRGDVLSTKGCQQENNPVSLTGLFCSKSMQTRRSLPAHPHAPPTTVVGNSVWGPREDNDDRRDRRA